jgi:carboxypeptidase C (cathepsin A)
VDHARPALGEPKFLAGESYGTTRAAALANHLQERHGMYLNGLVLISSILDFQTARFDVGNDLPYVLFLPTYTADGLVPQATGRGAAAGLWRDAGDEVERFASGEYALGADAGRRLSAGGAASALRPSSGASPACRPSTWSAATCASSIGRFCKELLRDERRTVGPARQRASLGIDRDAAGERYEYDPSYAAILGPFSGAR